MLIFFFKEKIPNRCFEALKKTLSVAWETESCRNVEFIEYYSSVGNFVITPR